jgi:hypothetical protein
MTSPRIDYTAQDYASLRDAMLALGRERLAEWTDQSPNDLGVLLVELFATMGDALFYHQDRIAAESYLDTAVERRSVLNLLRLIGYELRGPTPASGEVTLRFEAGATGTLAIEPDTAFTARGDGGEPVTFRYVRERLLIDRDALPREGGLAVYRRLPVVQADARVRGEIVGSSDGSRGQRFPLARAPMIPGSLVLTVDDGGGPRAWTRVESLLHSLGDDEHYALRRDERDVTWIELGDGRYGKAPARGRNNLVASYLVGGGNKGNVGAGAIAKAVTTIDRLAGVRNELPATGGADTEPTAEAAARGPRQFRSMGRAVTAADYEAHARSFGVAKARARATGAGRIVLHVAPIGGGRPSDTLQEELLDYFESRRIITSQLAIAAPDYVSVALEATLEVTARAAPAQVQQRATDAIRALWSFERVGFGDTLFVSKAYEAIQEIDGVAGVVVTAFTAGGVAIPDGRLALGPTQIPVLQPPSGITFTKVTRSGRDG